ncbi:MAG: mechanosensitive ion channel family protein [Gammaproteobacteria bacterium]|nr:mechanosensitive ion channel family protein [Gammaproteobacteria bacterium]
MCDQKIVKKIIQLFLWAIIVVSPQVFAKELTIKDVAEAEKRSETISEEKVDAIDDTSDKSTPLKTLISLKKSANNHNWKEAASYLDLRYIEPEVSEQQAETLVRHLQILWKQQHVLDLSVISNEPEGHQNDKLPAYRDLIGYLKTRTEQVPIYLQRVPDGQGGKVWKISNTTVSQLSELWNELGYNPIIESISTHLPDFEIFGLYNWQFIGLLLIIIMSWILSALVRSLLQKLFSLSRHYKENMLQFIRIPLRLFLFFTFINMSIGSLGLTITTRVWLESGVLNYLAGIFLALGIIELVTAVVINRSGKNEQTLSIVRPLVTILKIVVVIIIILSWFEKAGYNVATILTGLGIGSLAVALAAQKTLENVFGAFTLYLAKPIQAGDFCQFGNVSGTVEEVGLRSTRIRKLDRSVVFVPNSVFASSSVENFSEIDRRLYNKELRITLETTPEQIRHLLIELRTLIVSHSKTLDMAARVRFENIERDCFLIIVNAYTDTNDLEEYKAIAEDLNLRILEILAQEGVRLAIPEQQINISRKMPIDETPINIAKEKINEMIEKQELPFPDFSPQQLDSIKNSIQYPSKGSSTAKK